MVLCEGRYGRGSPSYLDIEGGSQGSSHSFRRGYGSGGETKEYITPRKKTSYLVIHFAMKPYELVNIAASKAPQLVDFDDMLMERPFLFTRVAITPKTKPRESLIPEAVSSSPSATGVALPTPSINPLLKRMASDAPTTSQPSKRAKKSLLVQKKSIQVKARDSSGEGSRHQIAQSPTEAAVTRSNVVTLGSSTTPSDKDLDRKMETTDTRLSLPQELNIPFPSPFQQVVVEEEVLPSRGKAVCKAQGEEAGPSAPRFPKYSGLYLAKPYKIPNLEVKNDSPWGAHKFHFHLAKPLLLKELAAQYSDLVDPYAAFAQAMKHINQAIMELLCWPGEPILWRLKTTLSGTSFAKPHWELERAKLEEVVVARVKRDADRALASAADEAESARIHFENSTLLSFLSSPAYEKKVGSECAAYLHSLVSSTQGRFPDLVALFNEEVARRPDWYRGLTLPIPKGAVLLEEGGETPNPPPPRRKSPP
ncbi:hypothetical protein LIER_14703 [Lithospermum erythrorhizon]|uniref:Uncharacterized protein n=1 Tax=Lithospermum erythrorhizon TaxID=34254 RepID=A0AAV3Q0H8_LITER